jgi:Circadian oscillating protein COP23
MRGQPAPFIPKFASALILGAICAVGSQSFVPSPAQPGRKFHCELVRGIPTTVVQTVRGNIPAIRWVKSLAGGANRVDQRCNEVSARLDRFNRAGKLKFIRTGNVNSYPVLCVEAGVSGNTCPLDRVLVTLPKGSDASHILSQMLDLQARATGKIIQLSDW